MESCNIEGIEKISTKFFIIHNADGSFETDIADMYELSSRYNFVFYEVHDWWI